MCVCVCGGEFFERSFPSPSPFFPLPPPPPHPSQSLSPVINLNVSLIFCFIPISTDKFKHFGDTSTNSTNGADSKGGAIITMITSYVDTRRLIEVGDEYDDSE